MPPRTRPALVPRAHDTSIFLYWRATSLLSSAPLVRASLLSSGIRPRTSPPALRRRAGRSFERFLRNGFIVILEDRASAHVLRGVRLVSCLAGPLGTGPNSLFNTTRTSPVRGGSARAERRDPARRGRAAARRRLRSRLPA